MISPRYQNNYKPILDLNGVQLSKKRQIENKISSGHYKFEEISCAICSRSEFLQLAEKDRYGLYCSNVVCRGCGLVMINPRMTKDSYNEFYNQEYRSLYSGVELNAAGFFKAQNLRGKRLHNYLTTRKLISNNPGSTPFILEEGCGAGGILNYFKTKGFKMMGIDLGEEYLNFGKKKFNLDLNLGTLKDIIISRSPDFIIYSHVLEHVLDLNEELEVIKNVCGINTLIYIEVPGLRNISLSYRNDPLRYFQNAHPYSFSLTSLSNLFAKHNFELILGNEYVKAVFRSSHSSLKRNIQNEFDSILHCLKTAESSRKYYFISFSRLRVFANSLIEKLKELTQIILA